MSGSKLASSLREAVQHCGLRDGMTVSFHHHLRDGDHVLNLVLDTLADMGLRDLTVNASALLSAHAPIIEHIKSGVVTGLETNYMAGAVGGHISRGVLGKPVLFRTHGGRPSDMERGSSQVDVAFIAAPTSDDRGNCTGKIGKSACGSLGYAFADAACAKKVIVITDNLVPHPMTDFSIDETLVDCVVQVDSIGDPAGIVSGTTRITRDPVGLRIADYAVQVIEHSGLLQDGFSFQTGAGGASLAAAAGLKELMLQKKIQGSFCMGGITGYLVDMLEAGCFESLMDVQCFDLKAVRSLRDNPRHREVSASHYAGTAAKSSLVDALDVVILGATEIDKDFNVNVHTDSTGGIMGGSGGHSDTAAGSKLCMIVAPLLRARTPVVTDQVLCTTTPGSTVDVLVTQRGIAVNPARGDLRERLLAAHLPVVEMAELIHKAREIAGNPAPVKLGDRVIAKVLYRDGNPISEIMSLPADN